MHHDCSASRDHYDRFLAGRYLWMAGGFRENAERNRAFFRDCKVSPVRTGIALDLGAGCGFQSIPLAERGFRVTALDSSRAMLDELVRHDTDCRIECIEGDILIFPLWSGRRPELIACMGDTLAHLSGPAAIQAMVRQCYTELVTGGTLVLSFRDYSREPDGTVTLVPVRSDEHRIFLCRLTYEHDRVLVTDILFSRESGAWERLSGTYRKLRIGPAGVRELLVHEGFPIMDCGERDGMITILAVKP